MAINHSGGRCTGAAALAAVLRLHSVKKVFAVVGNQVNDIAIALAAEGVELITCRHEGTAALMAEAYARTSRQIGVVLTIPGPGVANAAVGLLEAYTACSPVLLITAAQPRRLPNAPHDALFHGLDHVAACEPMTGYSATVADRRDFELCMARALATLEHGRPRPVMLEFDIAWMRRVDNYDLSGFDDNASLPVDAESMDRAAALVSKARKGVIVAGRAILAGGAESAFKNLVDRLGMPVLSTTLGKGALPESHPMYMGNLYEPACGGILADADLVLAVGTRFSQVDTNDWTIPFPSVPLVHIDPDCRVLGCTYLPNAGIAGELVSTIEHLSEKIGGMSAQEWDLPLLHAKACDERGPAPIIATVFNELLDATDALVVDVHEQGYPLVDHVRVQHGSKFLFPGMSLALGYGVPAAIGVRLANASGRVIAFCGDGGFLMSSAELATAARYALDLVFIVVNDNAYGTIKTNQAANHGVALGVDLTNPDFELLARSYGFSYSRPRNKEEVWSAVRQALSRKGPQIVEIAKSDLVE